MNGDSEKKYYELAYFLSPELNEAALAEQTEKLKKLIEDFGGQIEKNETPTKRKLAYPIKKYREGNFGVILFTAAPAKIPKLSEKLKFEQNIIRHLIVACKKVTPPPKKPLRKVMAKIPAIEEIKPAEEIKPVKEEKPAEKARPTRRTKPTTKAEVKLDELNKKLEEILKE